MNATERYRHLADQAAHRTLTLEEQREVCDLAPSSLGRKPPLSYDARQLRRYLVRNHAQWREESPAWTRGALVRIAHLERKSIEATTQEIDAETKAATGIGMFSQALANPRAL